ncbi:MAG: glycosyltransferase family 4 protein [Gammaproteobacteria bacterium]|nr:glycosyltransferase family 4 protein [Gammaproteobacteria bacterium]MDH3846885.1 glycosyltransferase family 4 protein [Gammaproteobacteria bacterium]MDH3864159.1 glycosyltransferase family 4 protein [Gammaproteobacteria bacterium]MDH3906385.1 glycosyltransferase family 4 protein [Gammaproteobacteria bacterium]MDH3953758.1 glycosyltransferase family 4 protein [Gammaproteobacteria bacterium]
MAIRSLCVTEGGDRPTIETFVGMHRAGIEITVTCPPDHPNRQPLVDAGVPTLPLQLKHNFNKDDIATLRRELVRGDYHILHTFNSKAVTNGLRACKGLPVKVVCYRGIVGNLSFLDPMSWMRYLNPRIDRIICVCEAIRQWFLHMQPAFLRMPAERPVTIHKGHKLEWYTDAPVDLGQFGIPDDAFVIGCTAAYRPRKGIEYLIDAVAMLPSDIPVHLLLIGRMDSDKLTKKIHASPAAERIHRIGHRTDAPAVTAACDVFSLPSTKREGLARAIIEAMAYRVPSVVTDCGGSPELVVDGDCGYVVPIRDARALADAFEKLYRDPELRQRMGEAARKRIGTHFRNEDTVKKTIALYEELVPNPD